MLNCPGAKTRAVPPPAGSSSSVKTSRVSRRRRTMRYGVGSIGSGAQADRRSDSRAIDVEELKTSCVEALRHDGGEALEDLVAETGVGVAFAAQAPSVERDGAGALDGSCVELPEVGL